jgi:small subunit ribosomal protein S18
MNNTTQTAKPKSCHFCVSNIKDIDYKDVQTLRRFISSYAKIVPKKRSGVCSKHQRKLAGAIKRARIMSLLPFTNK